MSQDIGNVSWQKRGRSALVASPDKQETRGIPRVSSLILRAETEGFELCRTDISVIVSVALTHDFTDSLLSSLR